MESAQNQEKIPMLFGGHVIKKKKKKAMTANPSTLANNSQLDSHPCSQECAEKTVGRCELGVDANDQADERRLSLRPICTSESHQEAPAVRNPPRKKSLAKRPLPLLAGSCEVGEEENDDSHDAGEMHKVQPSKWKGRHHGNLKSDELFLSIVSESIMEEMANLDPRLPTARVATEILQDFWLEARIGAARSLPEMMQVENELRRRAEKAEHQNRVLKELTNKFTQELQVWDGIKANHSELCKKLGEDDKELMEYESVQSVEVANLETELCKFHDDVSDAIDAKAKSAAILAQSMNRMADEFDALAESLEQRRRERGNPIMLLHQTPRTLIQALTKENEACTM